MKKLIVNNLNREKRFVVMKDQKAEKIYIEQPKYQSSVGNIYLGIVTKVLPGMNAVFVNIGDDKNGFLHRDKIPSFVRAKGSGQQPSNSISSFIHQGERILVQIEKDATGTKGPRLSGIIEIKGDNLIYMPNGHYVAVSQKVSDSAKRDELKQLGLSIKAGEEGLIFRTSSSKASEQDFIAELNELRAEFTKLKSRAQNEKKPALLLERDLFFEQIERELSELKDGEVIVDDSLLKNRIEKQLNGKIPVTFYREKENIFSAYKVSHEIEKALKRIVWLDNGAYLIFDEVEALTVVDVNTGKFSGKDQLRNTVLSTNLLAAVEIARQIRLRDLAGMILIDFIDMKAEEDRGKVLAKFEAELRADERRTKVIGFTPLGILQLTRKKTKVSLSEALTTKCFVCEGTGRILSPETIAFQLERELWEHRYTDEEAVLVSASSEVIKLFSGEGNEHKTRLEDVLKYKILFQTASAVRPFYEIRQFGSMAELSEKAD